MEKASDYLRPELGAEDHQYEGSTVLGIIEPLEISDPESDLVISEAIRFHVEAALVSKPVKGRQVTLNSVDWEVNGSYQYGVMLTITLLRYVS